VPSNSQVKLISGPTCSATAGTCSRLSGWWTDKTWDWYVGYNPLSNCENSFGFVQYDMGVVGVFSAIYVRPWIHAYCQLRVMISENGQFSGEEKLVFACGNTKTYPFCPGDQVMSSLREITPTQGRFIRWTMGASGGGGSLFRQLLVVFAGSCEKCSINSFCPGNSFNESYKCPLNTYTLKSTGAEKIEDCRCPFNAFWNNITQNCSCQANHYHSSNSSSLIGPFSCNQCPRGSTSNENSRSIQDCICGAGFYFTNQSMKYNCIECPAWKYCKNGSSLPENCPPGKTASSLGSSTCSEECPIGMFCPGDGLAPKQCPQGSYAITSGNSACTTCEEGFYCPNTATKIPCQTLFFCPQNSIEMTPCLPGYYSCPKSSKCNILCPPGGFCPGNGTIIKCPLGTYSNGGATYNCTICEAGYYCDSTIQLSSAGCD